MAINASGAVNSGVAESLATTDANGNLVGPDGKIIKTAAQVAAEKAQALPGGIPLGYYKANPDGTLTMLKAYGGAQPGDTVATNGGIVKPDGTPRAGSDGQQYFATRTPSGAPATDNPNFKGQSDTLSRAVNTVGTVLKDNPLGGQAVAGYDAITGKPKTQVAGDLVQGFTGGAANVDANGNVVPGNVGGPVLDAAGNLVSGIGGALSPDKADSSGLNAVRDKALGTQDALTGRLQTLEQNPTVAPQSQLVQLDQTQIDPLRGRQTGALDLLTDAATGRVPSAAEILGRDQANRAAAQAYGSAAALQGGSSSGGALRQALDAGTQLVGDANTQLMAARAKEMSDARGQLVQGIGAARGQESADATTNANLDQNKNLANTQAAVTTHGQDVSEKGDLISGQNTALGIGASTEKAKVDADTANAASANAYKGAIVGGVAGAIPKIVSDRRAKTDVHGADLVQLAENAPGYTFEYKDPKNGPGRRVSVMAQDVGRSRMGKDMVQMDDDGDLVLDGANSLGAALAMSAKALRETEALKKRRR